MKAARVIFKLLDGDRKALLEMLYEKWGGQRRPFEWDLGDFYPETREEFFKNYKDHYKKDDCGFDLCPLLDDAWEEELECNYQYGSDAFEFMTEGWVPYSRKNRTVQPCEIEVDEHMQHSFYLEWQNTQGYTIKLTAVGGQDVPRNLDDEIFEDEDEWPFNYLADLYVILLRLDYMFVRRDLQMEYAYQILWQRSQWEERLRDEEAE